MASYAQQNKVTHAGVAVNNWAGDFECSVCRRKRLTASEFSKKMQERYKKDGNGALKCKICVDKAAADERAAAVAKTQAAAPSSARGGGNWFGGREPKSITLVVPQPFSFRQVPSMVPR